MGYVSKFILGGVTLLLCQSFAFGQYKTVKTEDLNLVYYNFGHEYLINHTIRSYTNALDFHKDKFNYQVTEPVTVIMSDFGDFAQGGASAVPNNVILMGIAPFHYAYETNPANERIGVLMKHELVHIIAQEKSSSADRFYRKLFAGKVFPDRDNPVSMLYSYLTVPRIFSPRWYHEGIAEYMTTWMSGGIGRVMGAYDEMMFRTMVRDSSYIYDAVGLESEGTTTDFEAGANSYMYGTRFMAYLSHQYGPESLLEWVSRDDDSKRFYARQFEQVYGNSLDDEWSEWIEWEKEWQRNNLANIRRNPVTQRKVLSKTPIGGVSSAIYAKELNKIIFAADLPGQIAHITLLDPKTGEMERVADINGSALYFVSSLAYDADSQTIFYTNDNNGWRDLFAVNIETGNSRQLIKDLRTGDLVFNPNDRSLWGVRHLNGIVSLIRIPEPYTEWNRVHSMPYGEDLFDIDISPDGKYLSAAIGDVQGLQKLVMMSTDSLMQGKFEPEEIYDFEVSSPASFKFSEDGKFLFGSSYYSGVSNITRYDIENDQMEWLTNVETGYFKPIPITDDTLMAFEYTGKGFLPVLIENKPAERVSAINFLGQEIVEKHPVVIDWMLPPPSPDKYNVDELRTGQSDYTPFSNMALTSAYPIIQGFKDYAAAGMRFNFNDPLRFHNLGIAISYSPYSSLAGDERFHASFSYEAQKWRYFGNYNGADFYDLFGPTKQSRKGYSIGLGRNFQLMDEVDKTLTADLSTAYYGGMERLPSFQNVITSFSEFVSLSGSLSYKAMLASLGAVDYEKGWSWELQTYHNYVEGTLFPRVNQNLDYGIALPIHHSSIWLRSSAGISFSPRREPLGNFYFGGFGNNWIDYKPSKRYRSPQAFPGADLNQIGGTNYGKLMVEWSLPPVRFKRAGFMNLYANWAQLNLFTTGLLTNIDDDTFLQRYYNAGAQLDFRLSVISILESTFSVGYASAWNDIAGTRSDELMISLRLMR
ncbi:MAG: hypothetical protein JJ953_07480 [Gracilimonas sp.]|uniref:TolB family protein n=1 Tax=Gracilimonas sp. TaxID=1974203 RepID=UPI001B21A5C8|nr:hypothetical protein [Gracilimonas sp.]MBO6585925.1 hypothetical protein [Gracilimonas sp.]MBO6616922.1 hypothetical protein [Gracilimonas sp.]